MANNRELGPQSELHKARRMLALKRTNLQQRQASWDAERASRQEEIAVLEAEVRRLSKEESARMEEAARNYLGGAR